MNLRLLRILLWAALYLVILEVALEVRAYHRGFDTILFDSFQRQEAVGKSVARAQETALSTSFLGEGEKQPGEVRYWIASSSHAEDSYLSRDVIFPSRLESMLRQSGIQATVVNASHAGMDIPANRKDLESRGPRVKPDVVILYQMSIQIGEISKRLLSTRRFESKTARTGNAPSPKPQANRIVRLFESTSIYALLKGNVSNRLAGQRVLADTLGVRGESEFEAMVRDLVESARQIGAEPVLCTFATSHVRKHLPHIPDEVPGLLFRYNVYLSLEGWISTIERFNAILRRIAEEEHLVLIDLEGQLAGHGEYFRDFVHFTPEGHAVMARAIYTALVSRPRGMMSATSSIQQ
ncbi:MAG: hypothetical protein HY348_00405 [Nitrospira defluvii]|nr:hypothetical protein [Nitrospira defluvii]